MESTPNTSNPSEPERASSPAQAEGFPSPRLPDAREVLRAARAEALGHSMARRVF